MFLSMKKLIKVLAVLMCVILSFSIVACSNNGNTGDNDESSQIGKPTDIYMVENGVSDYKIVIPVDATQIEQTAANELQGLFYTATSVKMPIVTDAEDVNKYISIGSTEMKENKGLTIEKDVAIDSCKLVTVDENLYIFGTEDGYGAIYGVYEFLSSVLNYEFYSEDEIYIDKVDDLYFHEFNSLIEPSMSGRRLSCGFANSGLTRTRYRFSGLADIWDYKESPYHNSFLYFPLEDYKIDHAKCYSDNFSQLCYTAHGDDTEYEFLLTTLLTKYTEEVLASPNQKTFRFCLSLQDNYGWCTCTKCTEVKEKYGASSATQLLLLNDLSRRMNSYLAENNLDKRVDFVMFAYFACLQAPVFGSEGNYSVADDKILPTENVGILFAPLDSVPVRDMNDESNSGVSSNLKKWQYLTKNISFWLYGANFSDFVAPYAWWSGMKENLEIVSKTESFMMFIEDGWSGLYNPTCFGLLRGYLFSELCWNINQDVELLTENFFSNYFKYAKEPMRKLYDSLQIKLEKEYLDNSYSNGSFFTGASEIYFSYGDVLTWLSYIDEAYQSIEFLKDIDLVLYEKLYNRIVLESLTVRYLDIEVFDMYYSSAILLQKKEDFKKDCLDVKFTGFSDGSSINTLFSKWGLN